MQEMLDRLETTDVVRAMAQLQADAYDQEIRTLTGGDWDPLTAIPDARIWRADVDAYTDAAFTTAAGTGDTVLGLKDQSANADHLTTTSGPVLRAGVFLPRCQGLPRSGGSVLHARELKMHGCRQDGCGETPHHHHLGVPGVQGTRHGCVCALGRHKPQQWLQGPVSGRYGAV